MNGVKFMSALKFFSSIRATLVALVISIGGMTSADAAYDFRMVGGQRSYAEAGNSICVDLTQDSPEKVRFTIWSQIPQPATSIEIIKFDTGRHKDLFSDISVLSQSPGGTIKKAPPSDAYYNAHAYLPQFNADYVFRKDGTALYHPGGISTGESLALSATLSSGKTAADVVVALREGSNPATETSGLRIGVILYHLRGKRRNPNITEGDDGGFVTNAFSPRCQQR